jgi:hypothetical protein
MEYVKHASFCAGNNNTWAAEVEGTVLCPSQIIWLPPTTSTARTVFVFYLTTLSVMLNILCAVGEK